MDIQFVEKLIGLVETSRLAELEYSTDGKRIKLSKFPGACVAPVATVQPPQIAAPVSFAAAPLSASSPALGTPATAEQHSVVAGLGGTFFTRPAPGEEPFVKVGDTVSDGQQLGIVEAMKMLNSVESDVSGVIVRVCVEEGEAVSAGAELFVIEVR